MNIRVHGHREDNSLEGEPGSLHYALRLPAGLEKPGQREKFGGKDVSSRNQQSKL